jgi:hypothetical protein
MIYSSMPKATFVPPLSNSTYLPLANGTRLDCHKNIDGGDVQYDVSGTLYDSVCELIAFNHGIALEELENW